MPATIALRLPADTVTAAVTIDPTANPSVSPEVLPVREATLISFRLPAGVRRHYVFASQPAPIVVSAAEGFDPPVRRSDSWVTMLDRKSVDGDFKYTVNLVDTRTGLPVTIDPVIRNEQ